MSIAAPDGRVLSGRYVRLEPASQEHAAGLFAALDDERVWAAGYGGGPAGRPADQAGTSALLQVALDAARDGVRQAYVVRLADGGELGPAGTIVGTSSLGEGDLVNERVHLGWTAYGPPWWGGVVNAESKLLLLGHAFDDCGFGRVKLQTDNINARSQAAIARLGATREGVLRRHIRRADGSFRDTVVFSVLRDEWPDVRTGLLARLP
jgi:RimJ/RimL family protein N-acetyltransferase